MLTLLHMLAILHTLTMTPDPGAFRLTNVTQTTPEKPYNWTPGHRNAPTTSVWPPKGVQLVFSYASQRKSQLPPPAPPYYPFPRGKIHTRGNVWSFTVG